MNALKECGLCRIDLRDVGVTQGQQVLLEGVSMHLHCGELTALIGPNGAGKTTLLRALLGEVPYTGRIAHLQGDGKPASNMRTGYVPQQLLFDRSSPVTVQDFFAASHQRKGVWLGVGRGMRDQVRQALSVTHAEALTDRRLGALSGGELQRVLLALALWPVPNLLILDEPVSGVDAPGLRQFYETVMQLRADHHLAILLVSHDLSLVRQYADQVVLLEKRVLCTGTPGEVFESREFARVFQGGDA